MSAHPCAGHPCDHCYLCDVVGVCCQSVGATDAGNRGGVEDRGLAVLRVCIERDVAEGRASRAPLHVDASYVVLEPAPEPPSTRIDATAGTDDLARSTAEAVANRRALPAAADAASGSFVNSRKEESDDHAA